VTNLSVADAVMEAFVIEGGQPLSGRVKAAGNKNGALPILAASLLTDEPVVVTNVPRITDVETMVALIADLGADIAWVGPNEIRVGGGRVDSQTLDEDLCSRIRASTRTSTPSASWALPSTSTAATT